MAPIIKHAYQRRTCRVNVPPILSLRKKEIFDCLLEHHDSNPFLTSSEAEYSSSGSKHISYEDISSSLVKSSGPLFFPEQKSSLNNSLTLSGKFKKYNRVQKKKRLKKLSDKKCPELIEYHQLLSNFLKNSSSVKGFASPVKASTPLKEFRRSSPTHSSPMPFDISTYETSVRTSNDQNHYNKLYSVIETEISKLSIDENQCISNLISSSTGEHFYGFSSVRASLLEETNLNKNNEGIEVNQTTDADNHQIMSQGTERNLTEDIGDETDPRLDEMSILICNQNVNRRNVSVTNENTEAIEEGITNKQVIEDHISAVEEKDPDNEDSSTCEESPCFEKENVIIICEQESLPEDDEDKSEDVSSALSSDQEAREGISSSDLESNSIDEEKDLISLEFRRHSFEKISSRKSCTIGPFSRRRCFSLVPSVLSEGKESYVPATEHETIYNFQPNKHYVTCDSIKDQNQKSILIFNDSASDLSDEERIGGRSPPTNPALSAYTLYENSVPLDPLPENLEENQDDSAHTNISHSKNRRTSEPSSRRKSNRLTKDLSPSRQSPLSRPSVSPDLNIVVEESDNEDTSVVGNMSDLDLLRLPANKKYRRSLSIIRQLSKDEPSANLSTVSGVHKGRGFEQFVEQIINLQTQGDASKAPTRAYRKSLSIRRSSLLEQRTPPRGRRASRISSIQTSPVGLRQFPSKRPSLSASLLNSCNRTQLMKSPFKNSPLHPNQTLLQNKGSRFPCQMAPTDELSEVRSANEIIEGDDYTYKDHVMILCEQKEPISFLEILDDCALEEAVKVGEGVYGEVFMIARPNKKNVLKIIPIEGDFLVNGEKQKRYEEIYTELIITKWLDLLRDSDNEFMTVCFAELMSSSVIKGKYPNKLLELWDEYDERKGSDNDRPDIFSNDQLYIVLELGNAGTDLESYSFSTAKQALSIFKQTVFAMAVAEACFEFEHRDLHWGNVLISRTAERYISFRLQGKEYKVITNGVKSTIIDYTLSRITFKNNIPVYNDIGQDPDIFIATGDYQFDIYRHMKKDVCDCWDQFVPKTNVRWLHYLIDKMLKKVKYQRKTAKVHRDSIRYLQDIESWILNCDTSVAIALKLAEDN